jgi:hypothetical protein
VYGVPKPGTGGMMLELQVADVDQEYKRLHSLGLKIDFVLPPHHLPLGQPCRLSQGPGWQSPEHLQPRPRPVIPGSARWTEKRRASRWCLLFLPDIKCYYLWVTFPYEIFIVNLCYLAFLREMAR